MRILGKHLAMCIIAESLYCIPETNISSCTNYTSFKKINMLGFYIQPMNTYWISQERGSLRSVGDSEEIKLNGTDLITCTNFLTHIGAELKSDVGHPTPNAVLSPEHTTAA